MMDYTPYYYNYNPKNLPPKREFDRCKKGTKSQAFLVCLIVVCLVVALYLAGRFSGVDIYQTVVNALSQNDISKYYLVTTQGTEYKEDAVVKCTTLRLSGNAGYLYSQNNLYFVALATYSSENTAKEVIAKNEDLVLVELTFNAKKMLSTVTDDSITKECLTAYENTILSLENLIFSYAKNELTLVETLHALENEHSTILTLKQKVIDRSPDNEDSLIALLDVLIGGLNAIVGSSSHHALLGEMRYVMTSAVVYLSAM